MSSIRPTAAIAGAMMSLALRRGFFQIAPEDLPLLIDETKARAAGLEVRDSYDEVLRALVLADRFGYHDVTGTPWTEIDFPEDIRHAREVILPALEEHS